MTAFCASPQLGPPIASVIASTGAWYGLPPMSGSNATTPVTSPKPLAKCVGSDGIEYIFCKAGGSINASTQVAIDSSGVATTGGSSGFYTQSDAVTSGQYFWAKKAAV